MPRVQIHRAGGIRLIYKTHESLSYSSVVNCISLLTDTLTLIIVILTHTCYWLTTTPKPALSRPKHKPHLRTHGSTFPLGTDLRQVTAPALHEHLINCVYCIYLGGNLRGDS